MPRVDDYRQARDLAVSELARFPREDSARSAGFAVTGDGALAVDFLDRRYRLSYPQFEFSDIDQPDKEVPLQEQVLILHYLAGSRRAVPVQGEWAAYREIPGATFYFGAFLKRAVNPLKKTFGRDLNLLRRSAERLGGSPVAEGDAGFEFRVFPQVPIRIIIWAGDEEFEPEATILFDRTVGAMLSAEDIAWTASLLVYRLIALAHT